MNRAKYIGSRVFPALVIFLLAGACGRNDAVHLRYQVEKGLYDAQKFSERLAIRPEKVTESQRDSLREAYVSVMRLALDALGKVNKSEHNLEWTQLQRLAFRASDLARSVDFARRQFRRSYELMDELLSSAPLGPAERLATLLNKARSAQALGMWDTALAIYNGLIEEYNPPIDPYNRVISSVLNLPYDIYRNEGKLKDSTEMAQLARETEEYYRSILRSFPHPDLRVATHAILAAFYYDTRNFEKAIGQLDSVIDTTGQQVFPARVRAWNIKMNSLGRFAETLEEIRNYKRSNPDTLAIPVLLFKEAECLVGLGRFAEARDLLYIIKNEHQQFFYGSTLTQELIAKSFEREGRWERAENEYRFLGETFATTPKGFQAYLLILNHYENAGPRSLLESWRKRALDYYDNLILRYSGTGLEASARSFKAEVYRREREWSKAAEELAYVANNFPETDIGRRSALTGALIYRDKLSDTASADALIELFRKSFPGEREELAP